MSELYRQWHGRHLRITAGHDYLLLQYEKEDLAIDVDAFRDEIAKSHQEAIALSIEVGYITPDNIKQILAKAAQSATSVSVEAGYLTDDNKEQVLQKADAQAKGLASKAKDYKPA